MTSVNSVIEEVKEEKIFSTPSRRKRFASKSGPNIELSEKLYQLRKQAGLTQKDVADRLNIKQPTYARMENGQNLTIKKIHEVALACNADVEINFRSRQTS